MILTKDKVIQNIELSNLYLKYYLDVRKRDITPTSTVAYAYYNGTANIAFGFISFRDLELDTVTLKDVPVVTTISGDRLFNSGTNFIIVG